MTDVSYVCTYLPPRVCVGHLLEEFQCRCDLYQREFAPIACRGHLCRVCMNRIVETSVSESLYQPYCGYLASESFVNRRYYGYLRQREFVSTLLWVPPSARVYINRTMGTSVSESWYQPYLGTSVSESLYINPHCGYLRHREFMSTLLWVPPSARVNINRPWLPPLARVYFNPTVGTSDSESLYQPLQWVPPSARVYINPYCGYLRHREFMLTLLSTSVSKS